MKKILFVCLGNICRSSTAEGVMLHLIEEAGLEKEFVIDSAGILSYHQGRVAGQPDACPRCPSGVSTGASFTPGTDRGLFIILI